MANPKEPAGGYQQGGWYEGRQYFNGTFSNPGQIHSQSDQPGAGGMVNPAVVAQSNIDQGLKPGTNEAYLQQQQGIVNPQGTQGAVGTPTVAPQTEYDKQLMSKQGEIDKLLNESAEQKAMISENPFLSESSLSGRLAKIDKKVNEKTTILESQKKFIQDRITAQTKANEPDYQITTETDNTGNMTIVTIDKKTGKLVNTVNAGKIGKATKGGGGTSTGVTKSTINSFNTDAGTIGWSQEQDEKGNAVNISPFMKLVIKYAPKMSLAEVYKYYQESELGKQYGTPTEDPNMITALYNQARGL
jgi:hypothetical protein